MTRCRRDPLFFSRHVLGGDQPWERQAEVLLALRDAPRVAVRSGHGVGKTWIAARAAIWYLFAHPHSIVLTTAPTHRQVRSILWAEIRKQVRASRFPLGGKITETRLALADDWFALGLSTDDPDRFQGYHAEHLLLIFDEAPGVPEDIYEAARGLLTSRHARLLLIGNPTQPAGPFYEAFRRPGWHTLHIACTNSPNVLAGRTVYPKLVTADWIETQRLEWGEDSPAFKSRVLGEFPEESDSRLIPLAWIHAAQERANDSPSGNTSPGGPLRMGVDVARYGADQTAIVIRDDISLRALHTYSGRSTMETAGLVLKHAADNAISPGNIAVDDSGLGGGVTDRLHEQGSHVLAVNAASSPDSRNFANRRAELYWRLREALNPAQALPIAIPKCHLRLAGELSHLTYSFNSRGRILLASKDALRSYLGHSPDAADALALTFASDASTERPPRIWSL